MSRVAPFGGGRDAPATLASLALAVAAANATPADELASFTLADGFQALLFASEQDGVVKPIQIRFDARGRLWVIGSTVYPQLKPGEIPNDKVLILEDTDGDGRSDRATVFADGLMIPTGLETLADGSGCYVGHGPELLLLKDTDGDGRADERTVVLRGFGTGDNHQNINSFLWGPDGALWFCQGLHTHSRVETPHGLAKLDEAGLWRLQPRTLRLDGFFGDATEPQNPWGYVFTDAGEPITFAGNNHTIIYPVPGLVKRPTPAQVPLLWPTGRGRKQSGGEIVGTTHFPEAWQGRLITGGYINHAIWTMTIEDDGAGFRLRDAEPLVTSTHGSFRPVDVKFGPDGALYVCDWYNPIIGHYQASFRHPDRDKTHGRIWRITAKGRALTTPPKLAGASVGELAAALTSPDRWTRRFAKRLLSDQPRDEVVAAVRHPGAARREIAAIERLGVLADHRALAVADLAPLVTAEEPALRAQVASLLSFTEHGLAAADVATLLRPLAADPHPRVRLRAIVAATWLDTPEAVELVMAAAEGVMDPFLEYAIHQAVASLKPQWGPAFREGRLTFESHPERLARLIRADGTADTLEALRGLRHSSALDPSARETFAVLLTTVGTPEDLAGLLAETDPALMERLLPALVRAAQDRGIRPAEDVGPFLRARLDHATPAIREGALRLVGLWGVAELQPTLAARAATSPGALAGLVALDPAAAATLAARHFATDDHVDDAAWMLPAFFQRQGGAAALAAAFRQQAPAQESARALVRAMNERGLLHDDLSDALALAAALPARRWGWSQDFAVALAAEVKAHGDPTRGRAIYHRAELACAACHSLGGEGGKIGPALDSLGTAQPLEIIIGAVLAPQKEIKESYEALQLTLTNGEVAVGYRQGATARGLTVRDPASGETRHLPRESLAEEKSLGSLMPAGLVEGLSREELRDLFSFLGGLGKPAR